MTDHDDIPDADRTTNTIPLHTFAEANPSRGFKVVSFVVRSRHIVLEWL